MNLYLVEAKVQLIHLLRNFRLSIFNILIFTILFVSGWSLRVHLHMLIAAMLRLHVIQDSINTFIQPQTLWRYAQTDGLGSGGFHREN